MPRNRASGKILVVDDQPSMLRICGQALRQAGYWVQEETRPVRAVELAEVDTFDLLLTDIVMPEMGGLELLAKVKLLQPNIIPIIMTGYKDVNVAIKAFRLGAQDFILKPFKADQLVASVQSAVKESQSANEAFRAESITPLLEINKVLASEIDPNKLFKLIVETLARETQTERVSLMLLDSSSMCLTVEAAVGLPEEVWKNARERVGDGFSGSVILSKEPMLITGGDLMGGQSQAGSQPVGQGLCVPLLVKGRAIGVLTLAKTSSNATFKSSELELISVISGQVASAVHNAQLYGRLHLMHQGTVQSLVRAIEAKDPYTRGHSSRVADYSSKLGEALSLPGPIVADLAAAGLLHDVGKIGVPEAILLKPSALTDKEMAIMRNHPNVGAEIVIPAGLSTHTLNFIQFHHERYDGSGYPQGLAGEIIPLPARIAAVADAFEAMTSDRAYRPALSVPEAIGRLRASRGTQFDPLIVDCFIPIATEVIRGAPRERLPMAY